MEDSRDQSLTPGIVGLSAVEGAKPIMRLWPDPVKGPLRLRVWFGTVNDRPAIVGLELWGVEPIQSPWNMLDQWIDGMRSNGREVDLPPEGAAIKAKDSRLPLGAWLEARVEMEYSFARAYRQLYGHVPGHEERVQKFEEHIGKRKIGRPSLSDEMLENVVEVYNAAVRAGDRKPAMHVFKELGGVYGAAVPETARSWVRRARKRWPDRVLDPPQITKRTIR